ncbi:uncharacterized protein LOC132630383 [Lycium barbarum]|uniref:uncharacterized protein LOC132630383 n=1 Tax=Lycium barbarum TaxID=112863 RepID=UPI00293EAAB5|nr:uncharacterized protein LOC132630383 [Lycium barbarum]
MKLKQTSIDPPTELHYSGLQRLFPLSGSSSTMPKDRSYIWEHFEMVNEDEEVGYQEKKDDEDDEEVCEELYEKPLRVQCMRCGRNFAYIGTHTFALEKHNKICHALHLKKERKCQRCLKNRVEQSA